MTAPLLFQREVLREVEAPTGAEIVAILSNEGCPESNFELLKAILVSDTFQPHVQPFLRFVTSLKTLVNPKMRIAIEGDPTLSPLHWPTAQTCFKKLLLSATTYDSQAQLQGYLEKCTEHCEGFGEK